MTHREFFIIVTLCAFGFIAHLVGRYFGFLDGTRTGEKIWRGALEECEARWRKAYDEQLALFEKYYKDQEQMKKGEK